MSIRYIRLLILLALALPVAAGSQTAQGNASPQDTASQSDEPKRPSVRREQIEYQSQGRRDPFQPLIEEKDEGEEELPLLKIEDAVLVGIMKGPTGAMALVKDAEQRTYVLHEGSKIKNGYLSRVKSDAAIFHINKYGRFRTVELELKSEKKAESFEQGVLRTVPRTVPSAAGEPLAPVRNAYQQSVPEGLKYTLQVAAFRQESQARRLQRWLGERGCQVRIEEADIPESGRWYRVRYGAYDTYDAVRIMAEDLRQRFAFYCWVVPIDS